MNGLGHHAQQVDFLAGEDGHHVEQGVLHMAAEHVAGHELGGRHVLQGGVGENLTGHLGLSELIEEAVFHVGVNLKGVAQAHLILGQSGPQGKGLVEELGGQHGVGLLHGVGGGQVVVLAGVNHHARIGVDGAGEGLVHQGPLHVDVPEQNAVQRVVEHHVQALERAHGGDFGHTQAGAVVAHADIAAQLLAHLVHGLPHEAEVFLGGVGAAEALGSGAVGHIVQQGLAGGADDGDNVGALAGGGGGLDNVLIDIAGGHNQVDPGAVLLAAVGGDEVLPALAAGADLLQACLHDGSKSRADVRLGVGGQGCQIQRAGGDLLSQGLRVPAGLYHGIAQPEGGTLRQGALFHQVVHYHAGQGDAQAVFAGDIQGLSAADAVDSQQAADGALHGHGGVPVDKPLGFVGNLGGVGAGLFNQFKIKVQFGFQIRSHPIICLLGYAYRASPADPLRRVRGLAGRGFIRGGNACGAPDSRVPWRGPGRAPGRRRP